MHNPFTYIVLHEAQQQQQQQLQQQQQQHNHQPLEQQQNPLQRSSGDGTLSPTSNQLARWFSPELLAQASAGKLPKLPSISAQDDFDHKTNGRSFPYLLLSSPHGSGLLEYSFLCVVSQWSSSCTATIANGLVNITNSNTLISVQFN